MKSQECIVRMTQISQQLENHLNNLILINKENINNYALEIGKIMHDVISLGNEFNYTTRLLKEEDIKTWLTNGLEIKDKVCSTMKSIRDEHKTINAQNNQNTQNA